MTDNRKKASMSQVLADIKPYITKKFMAAPCIKEQDIQAICQILLPRYKNVQLMQGLTNSEVKKLRLITNDPEHALLANQFIDGEIILAGSEMLRPDTALAGKQLEQALQHFTITHSILEISHLDADGTLNINVPRLAAAWQLCFDHAQNKTVIVAADPAPSTAAIGHLHQAENVIVSRSINEQYQQQLQSADFVILYTSNECFTWSNRERLQE